MKEWVRLQPIKPVVILDSLSRFIENENSARDVHMFFRSISQLKRQGVTFIILHHLPKSDVETRGATELQAATDYGFQLTNVSPDRSELSRLRLQRVKTRSATPFGDSQSRLEFSIVGGE